MTITRKLTVFGVAAALVVFGLLAGRGVVALAAAPTPGPQNPNGWGPGSMMGGNGGFGNMMGGNGGFGNMMGGNGGFGNITGGNTCPLFGGSANNTGTPLTLDQAIQAAQRYVAGYNNPDLQISEVMEFDNNFYASIAERSTGIHAFEVLVDRFSGAVHPEPGPNMMWNTKYGMMGGGMMGGFGGMMGGQRGMMGGGRRATPAPAASSAMAVTPEQASAYAQTWLNANQPGTTAAEDLSAFYGYYTMDFERDGQPAGMLSVNGYSGAVWYHSWHGAFIAERAVN